MGNSKETKIVNLALSKIVNFMRANDELAEEIRSGDTPNGKPINSYYFSSKNTPSWRLREAVGELETQLKKEIRFTGRLYVYQERHLPKYAEKIIWPLGD